MEEEEAGSEGSRVSSCKWVGWGVRVNALEDEEPRAWKKAV